MMITLRTSFIGVLNDLARSDVPPRSGHLAPAKVETILTILRDVPGPVPLDTPRRQDVEDVVTACCEQLGDQPTVAAPPRRLCAHEARHRLREGRLERALPRRRAHPGSVTPEGGDADAGEPLFAGFAGEPSAELDRVPIVDSGLAQGRRERLLVELRIPPGRGETSDVHEGPDARVIEAGEQLLDGARSVTDREYSQQE